MSASAQNIDRFQLGQTSLTVSRMGFGAMRLCGSHAWGPPSDKQAAIAVLREAVTLGVRHIDTAEYYGPHVVNSLIREALNPYPSDLVIATKIGFKRGADGAWIPAASQAELEEAVYDNLRSLNVDALDIVHLRCGSPRGLTDASVAEPLSHLMQLQRRGLVKHIGLSNVTRAQVEEGLRVADIVCVQNQYNLAHREDDALIDTLARMGVAYTPFFPLGGLSPLQSSILLNVAAALNASPMQVALAWLLHRAPNVLLIPGTSSIAHLRENVVAMKLHLSAEKLAELDRAAGRRMET